MFIYAAMFSQLWRVVGSQVRHVPKAKETARLWTGTRAFEHSCPQIEPIDSLRREKRVRRALPRAATSNLTARGFAAPARSLISFLCIKYSSLLAVWMVLYSVSCNFFIGLACREILSINLSFLRGRRGKMGLEANLRLFGGKIRASFKWSRRKKSALYLFALLLHKGGWIHLTLAQL